MKYLHVLSIWSVGVLAQSGPPPTDDFPFETLPENVKPFITALINANASTIALDTAILSFQDIEQVPSVASASLELLEVIRDGTESLRPLANFTFDEADAIFAIGTYVVNLGYYVNMTVIDLVNKKKAFVDACAGPIVLDQITKQNQSAAELEDVIIGKLPMDDQDIASDIASTITVALNSRISVFATETTIPASCSSSGTTITTATTSVSTSMSGSSGTYTTATPSSYSDVSTSTFSRDCDDDDSTYSTSSVSGDDTEWEAQTSFYPTSDCSYMVHPHPSIPTTVHPHPNNPATVHPHPNGPSTEQSYQYNPTTVHPHPSNPTTVHPHPSSPAYTGTTSYGPATTTALYAPYTGSAPIYHVNLSGMLAIFCGLSIVMMLY